MGELLTGLQQLGEDGPKGKGKYEPPGPSCWAIAFPGFIGILIISSSKRAPGKVASGLLIKPANMSPSGLR